MWTKETAKTKVKPSTDKLLSYLKGKGIEFLPSDGELDNVILTSEKKTVKIPHHSFYGYTRMGAVTKQKGEKVNEFEFVPITDEVYINSILKQIIDFHFKN